jgi:transcriptional regulator with XRE-family HTH domain
MIGVSPTTIQRYLQGRAQPGFQVIRRACLTCGVAPNWLLFGWAPKYGGERPRPPEAVRIVNAADVDGLREQDFVTVPVLGAQAWRQLEQGVLIVSPDTCEGFTVAPAALGGRLCAVRAGDDGMSPEIEAGDLLLVELAKRESSALEGRLVFAVEGGRGRARRYIGGLLFAASPRRRPPTRIGRRSVLGVIVQIRRDKKPPHGKAGKGRFMPQ